MRFGVSIGNLAPPGATVDDCLEAARLADRLGYDSVWVHDHVAVPARRDTPYPYGGNGRTLPVETQLFEPLVMMNALAVATDTARIGVCVLALPYRHPAVTAKMLATADLLSNGRIILGVGTGWMREEFEALGLPDEHFKRRGAVTDDYLRAVKEMWTNTAPSTYRGAFVSFEDAGTYPKPAQKPHPPIVVAGSGKAGMVRASRFGDGFQAIAVGPDELAQQVTELRDTCRRDRRDPDELEVFLMAPVRISEQPVDGSDRRRLHGTIEQIAEDLRAYGRAGLDHLICVPSIEGDEDRVRSRQRAIEVLAEEVTPAFGGGRAAAAAGR